MSLLNAQALARLVLDRRIVPEAIVFPAVRRDALFLSQLYSDGAAWRTYQLKKGLEELARRAEGDAPKTASWVRNLAEASLHLSPSLPNRALLVVPAGSAARVARAYSDALSLAWREISVAAGHEFANHAAATGKAAGKNYAVSVGPESLWARQVEGLLPVTWGVLAWPREEDELKKWRESAEDLFTRSLDFMEAHQHTLNALQIPQPGGVAERRTGSHYGLFAGAADRIAQGVKAARAFSPPPGEPWEKDTLLGEQEQIIPDALTARAYQMLSSPPRSRSELTPVLAEAKAFWKDLQAEQTTQRNRLKPGTLRPNERLGAVGLTKRMFPAMALLDGFPSTSQVASRTWEAYLIKALERDEHEKQSDGALATALDAFVIARDAFIEKKGQVLGDRDAEIGTRPHGEHRLPPSVSRATRARLEKLRRFDRAYLLAGSYELSDEMLRDRTTDADKKQEVTTSAKKAKEALRRFEDTARAAGLGPPPVYYALLFLDGDEMGKWASGENAPTLGSLLGDADVRNAGVDDPNAKRPLTPAHQAVFSEALSNFNALARRIVESGSGTIIYAGGDDVLAMVPVETALWVATYLRFAFAGQIGVEPAEPNEPYAFDRPVPRDRWQLLDASDKHRMTGLFRDPGGVIGGPPGAYIVPGPAATLSGGMVLAHVRSSLAQALFQVRRAETKAKAEVGRDALSVVVLKRSGETLEAAIRFVPREPGDTQHPGSVWQSMDRLPIHYIERLQEALTPCPVATEPGKEITPISPLSPTFPTRLRTVLAPLMCASPDRFLQHPENLIGPAIATFEWLGGQQTHRPTDDDPVGAKLRAQSLRALDDYRGLFDTFAESLGEGPKSPEIEGDQPKRSQSLGAAIEDLVLWPSIAAFLARVARVEGQSP